MGVVGVGFDSDQAAPKPGTSVTRGACSSVRREATWTFVRDDGPVETARSSIRIYSYKELRELLEAAGFCNFRDFLTGTEQPFRMGSQRLSIVAEKAGGYRAPSQFAGNPREFTQIWLAIALMPPNPSA